MLSVVIDSSVAIKWYVTEEDSHEARLLLAAYQSGALDFLAPDLIYAEIGSIVWKKHTLRGLPAPDAEAILSAFSAMPLMVTPAADLFLDAYRLAVATNRTIYDCLYLALSVRENCRFVTADAKLVHALGAAFPSVVLLADWT